MASLVFSTLMVGIGHMSDAGAVGRVGKAMYNRWLVQPLPTGAALNLSMSPHLAEMYRALGSPD